MTDLALAAVVLALVAVPVSLLLLALADVFGLAGEGRRRRVVRYALVALAVPGAGLLAVAVWGWAGAAHLGPLCAAYATPEFRAAAPLRARQLRVDSDQRPAPPWAATLADPASLWPAGLPERAQEASLRLEARRVLHHENRLFRVEMDRFRLVDEAHGGAIAEGDEIWIRAGRATWHCGIGSGPEPTDRTAYPAGDGVARFVSRALRGAGRP